MNIGQTVGIRYRLDAEIGAGTTATVWRATDVTSGRVVAIKALHPHLRRDPEYARRFRGEARVDIDHTRVVQVIDDGAEGDDVFIVMEFIDGEPLSALLSRGTLPAQRAQAIARDVADALAAAHATGTLHRDVKPANILIDRGGRAHLTDFGIARVAEATRATSTGMFMGSLPYASPEQFLGGVVPESDLYSLGVVLYEMLDGAPPFVADEAAGYMRMHLGETPHGLDVLERRHGLPAGVAARLLEKDPARRIASANEVVAILEGRAALSAPAPAAAADAATRVLQVRRKRPSPALMAIGALAVASVAASAVLVWTAGGSGDGVDAEGKSGVQNGASTPTPDAAAYVRAVATGEAQASATAAADAFVVALATQEALRASMPVAAPPEPLGVAESGGSSPEASVPQPAPTAAPTAGGQKTTVTVNGTWSVLTDKTRVVPGERIVVTTTRPPNTGAFAYLRIAGGRILTGGRESFLAFSHLAPCEADPTRLFAETACLGAAYEWVFTNLDLRLGHPGFPTDGAYYISESDSKAISQVITVYCPIPEPCDIR